MPCEIAVNRSKGIININQLDGSGIAVRLTGSSSKLPPHTDIYQYLTDGRALVLTPRFSPSVQEITYLSYATGVPRVGLGGPIGTLGIVSRQAG